MIRRLYAEALASRGYYYASHDRAESERSLSKARAFLSSSSEAGGR